MPHSPKRAGQTDMSLVDRYVEYYPKRIPCADCGLGVEFPAKRSTCKVFGKTYTVPRDQVVVFFDGQADAYAYSGHNVPTAAPTPTLLRVRAEVETLTGVTYNFVLINRYRDGNDGVGWHADDERTIDQRAPIVSVSYGATRDFDVRAKADKTDKRRFALADGDVVVMKPGCQAVLQHQLPKRAGVGSTRFNLTFRKLKK